MRRAVLVLAGAVLFLAACSSNPTVPGATGTTTPGGPTPSGTAPPLSGALAGVTVPDAFTALTLEPISSPTFPFKGTDGKYHISYDLLLTNTSSLPATVEKIDVVDAFAPSTVVASFSGTRLVDPACQQGDCNRLRLLPSANPKDDAIAPQEARAVLIDVAVDTAAQAPKAVLHHLYGTGKASPPARTVTPIDYLAAPFATSAGQPRVIGPPVKGPNWVALNGCCEVGWPHRTSLNSTNGKLTNSQRFAIDWKRTNDQGEFYTGDKTKNESYVDYGEPIYAVADGTVVGTLDTVDANAPGILPVTDPVLAAKITVENVDGNHIVLDIGGGVYAMYAHMIKGTLAVKVGDKVKKGDVIGKLGNTGNANASHMHFQLMDDPSLLEGDGLPYVIDDFVYRGQVAPVTLANADDYLSGSFFPASLPAGQPRRGELPLLLAIVDFPSP